MPTDPPEDALAAITGALPTDDDGTVIGWYADDGIPQWVRVAEVAKQIGDALTAAGYTVIKAAETRTEYRCDHGYAETRPVYVGHWRPIEGNPQQ